MKIRSIVAVALLAPAVALAAPTKSSQKAAAKPAASTSSGSSTAGTALAGLEVGGFIGYETDDLSGLSLRLDGELPFRQLSPQFNMSWVGSIGYSHLTWESGIEKLTTNTLKLVPAARFTMPLNPQFSLFGDAGLGIAYVSAKAEVNWPSWAGGHWETSDSTFNLMMRLGVGAWYQATPALKVGAMLEFDPIFGDYGFSGQGFGGSQNFFLIQVGAMYRL